jgi:hypothetical protein
MENLLETAIVKYYADLFESTVFSNGKDEINSSVEKMVRQNLQGIDVDELTEYIEKVRSTIVNGMLQIAFEGNFLPEGTPENAEAIIFATVMYTEAMENIALYMFQLGWKARSTVLMEVEDES